MNPDDQLIEACRAPDATADSICAAGNHNDRGIRIYFEHIADDDVLLEVLRRKNEHAETWTYPAFYHRSLAFCVRHAFREWMRTSRVFLSFILLYSRVDTAAKVTFLLSLHGANAFTVVRGFTHRDVDVRTQFVPFSSLVAVCVLHAPPAVMWRVCEAVLWRDDTT